MKLLKRIKKTGYAMRKRDELHKTAITNAMYARKPQTVINALTQLAFIKSEFILLI
jgi:prophage antirepressor-like protein